MEFSVLNELIEKSRTLDEMANSLNCSKTTVRYWLKKHNLSTHRGPHGKHKSICKTSRLCSHCGEVDQKKFYGNKKTICGKCHSLYTLAKGQEKREFALDGLGRKCIYCGYDKHMCSLDGHHIDANKKDLHFRTYRGWSEKRLKKELQACVLLCKNCHAAVHAKQIHIGA